MACALTPGRLFFLAADLLLPALSSDGEDGDDNDNGILFDLGDFEIAVRFVRPGPLAMRAAGARVERLRAAEDRRATGRARTPWKQDHVDATRARRAGKVYRVELDALDVIED